MTAILVVGYVVGFIAAFIMIATYQLIDDRDRNRSDLDYYLTISAPSCVYAIIWPFSVSFTIAIILTALCIRFIHNKVKKSCG